MQLRRTLMIVLVTLSLMSTAIAKEQVPFKGTVTGQVVSVTPISQELLVFGVLVSGISTQLGRFKGEGEIFQNVVTGSYSGTFTWRAANGDSISGSFTGQLIPTSTPGVFENSEEITVTSGTGRFLNVSGSAIADGQLDQNTSTFLFPFEGAISSVGS